MLKVGFLYCEKYLDTVKAALFPKYMTVDVNCSAHNKYLGKISDNCMLRNNKWVLFLF